MNLNEQLCLMHTGYFQTSSFPQNAALESKEDRDHVKAPREIQNFNFCQYFEVKVLADSHLPGLGHRFCI